MWETNDWRGTHDQKPLATELLALALTLSVLATTAVAADDGLITKASKR
jgi:hypothetical protein